MKKGKLSLSAIITALTGVAMVGSTFAWFVASRRGDGSIIQVEVEGGLKYRLLYYQGNYDHESETYSGYPSPEAEEIADGSYPYGVTDFFTDFLEVPSGDDVSSPLAIVDLYPGISHTFCIEVSSELMREHLIDFLLTSFVSPASSDCFLSGTSPAEGIRLASAINIYGTSFVYESASATANSDLAATANQFIRTPDLEDLFDYDSHGETAYSLGHASIFPEATHKTYLFFTLEFSNAPDTFFRFDYQADGVDYYVKDPNQLTGGSNVYQGLTFQIDTLRIGVVN